MKELAQEYIVELLNELSFNQYLDQHSFNELVKQLTIEFSLSKRDAETLTLKTLKMLYNERTLGAI